MLRDVTATEFAAALPGRRILDVRRRGKFLLLPLNGDLFLTLHLGMTGQLLLEGVSASECAPGAGDADASRSAPPPSRLAPEATVSPALAASPHDRFAFRFEAGAVGDHYARLVFRDMRKFGRVHLTPGSPPARVSAMGPDAWPGDDWDQGILEAIVRGRRAPLKALLLDQRRLAGIGNIYADEILFAAGLSPLRPAGSLNSDEVLRLAGEIRRTLGEGVRLRGCSISDYVDPAGLDGGFQRVLRAYGRQGQICVRCGGTMLRTIVAGRGTTYCPSCQR